MISIMLGMEIHSNTILICFKLLNFQSSQSNKIYPFGVM